LDTRKVWNLHGQDIHMGQRERVADCTVRSRRQEHQGKLGASTHTLFIYTKLAFACLRVAS
jgi:hypothetical protein